MEPGPSFLNETSRAALPGSATALAWAPTACRVVAADDRGEVGLWSLDGRRRAGFRIGCPVAAVGVSADGSLVAALGREGRLVVTDGRGEVISRSEHPGATHVAVSADGGSVHVVHGRTGRVAVVTPTGDLVREIAVPHPVAGYAVGPRSGNAIGAAMGGIVAAISPLGNTLWTVDLGHHVAGLGVDAREDTVLVEVVHRGAVSLDPGDGRTQALHDPGSALSASAQCGDHVLLATPDGMLHLFDRAGRLCGTARVASRARQLVVASDGVRAAARQDDGCVVFLERSSGGAPEVDAGCAGRARIRFRARLRPRRTGSSGALLAVSPSGSGVVVTDGRRGALSFSGHGEVLSRIDVDQSLLAVAAPSESGGYVVTSAGTHPLHPDAGRLRRSFPRPLVFADVHGGGALLATADTTGELRLLDMTRGDVILEFRDECGPPPRGVLGGGGSLVWQRADGTVVVAGPGTGRAVWAAPGGAELVAVTPLAIVLRTRNVVSCHGRDGSELLRHELEGPSTRIVVADSGRMVLATERALDLISGAGRPWRMARRPAGRPVALTAAGSELEVLVVEGRRIACVSTDCSVGWHATLESDVQAVAATPGGETVAATDDEHLTVFDAAPRDRHPPRGYGHDR